MSRDLDFRPAGAAAPRARQVWSHARTEASLILRNGEQSILSLVIPVGVLVAGRWFSDLLGQDFAVTAVSVLGLAIWSSTFTSLSIATGFERRYNVLERLAATPLGRTGILLGKATGTALITSGQLAVLALIAVALGWHPTPDLGHLVVAALAAVLAAVSFAGCGLALAGTAKPEATLAVANLVHLAGMAGGALLLPVARYPEALQPLIAALPTAALGEALRTGTSWSLLVLLPWALGALALSRKVFRWMS